MAQGLLHMAEQQAELGIGALRRAVELARGSTRPEAVLAVHLAGAGQHDEARAILNRLLAVSRARYVPPTSLAAVHTALGEADRALAALERALLSRDTRLIYLKDDPHWTGLHGGPRFVALMKKLKLDRYGPGLTPV
jgi:Flp pilus assembly protein TadD